MVFKVWVVGGRGDPQNSLSDYFGLSHLDMFNGWIAIMSDKKSQCNCHRVKRGQGWMDG